MAKKATKMFGRAIVQPKTLNKETREVEVVFATENPVARYGWSENYDEILSCEESAVRMERINRGLPVVDCHHTYSVGAQFGRSTEVWFDGKKMVARIRFSKRAAAEELFQDIEDGIVCDISVGYRVYKYVREPQAEGQNAIYRAVDWMPTEISFAPVQADIGSEVRSDNDENDIEIIESKTFQNQRNMEPENTKAGAPAPAPAPTVENDGTRTEQPAATPAPAPAPTTPPTENVADIRTAATEEMRTRLDAIETSVRAANLPDSVTLELYRSDKTIDACRQEIIERMAKADEKNTVNGAHGVRVGEESIDKKRTAIQGSILHRVAPSHFKLDEAAREYRGMTMIEVCKEMLHESGVSVRGMSKTDISLLVFGGSVDGMRAHSSTDFPVLFEGVIDKLLRAEYPYAKEFWDLIARQTTVADFRAKGFYTVAGKNGMKEIKEGGELEYTTLAEGKETIQVKSYGEGIQFTRQALINDDLSAFEKIPAFFAKDWSEQRGDLIWNLIIKNAKMGDGKGIFDATRGNLVTKALDSAGLTAAKLAMSKQTGITGRRLRILPKFLIVPPDLEAVAKTLLTQTTPANTTDVNIHANAFDLIVEPRLTDAKAWYLSADPGAVDTLAYAYLDGNEGLRVHTEHNFNTDTMDYGVRGDFGAAAVDYRGLVKSNGQ